MRKRTLVELGLLVLLLVVGAAVVAVRLRGGPDAPPPEPTPTPRLHSLIRTLGPVAPARTYSAGPTPAPTPSMEGTSEVGVVLVEVLEADGSAPRTDVEVITRSGLRIRAPAGRLALQAVVGEQTLSAQTNESPPRESTAVTVSVAAGAYTPVNLVLPATEAPIREAGVTLVRADGLVTVSELVPGGPAARAGLQPGDALLAVNGVSVNALTDDQLALALTGVEGDLLRLTLVIPNGNGGLEEVVVDLTL